MIRKEFLQNVLLEYPLDGIGDLMIALGLQAAKERKYVAITPHVQHRVPTGREFAPPADRRGLVESTMPLNRWYRSGLPIVTDQAYQIWMAE